MKLLDKAPLIRLALPFAAGILFSEWIIVDRWIIITLFTIIVSGMICCRLFTHKQPVTALRIIPLQSFCVMLAAMCAGWFAGTCAIPDETDLNMINGRLVAARISNIEIRDFSTSAEASISILNDSAKNNIDIPAMLSIQGNDYTLAEGDWITFKAALQPIKSLGNPDEFDYATYMKHRYVIYSQYLKRDEYTKIATSSDVMTCARKLQRSLTNAIIGSSMSPSTQRFLCTILLGESSYLDPDVREDFSHAGIAHILALSGLHMGIIMTIVFFILKPLDYIKLKHAKIFMAMACITIYLFITGMSASAVRATIMIAFVLIARLTYRRYSSLNSLFAAALLILAFSPYALYDVGFQLSFMSVLSILLLYDRFGKFLTSKNKSRQLLSSIAITTVATLGTAAISAYYFHVIPVLSIFSNIIVLPILPFYISIGLIHTFLLATGIEFIEFSWLLDKATWLLTAIADAVNTLPFSSIANIHMSTITLALFMLLYLLVIVFIYNINKKQYAIAILATILAIMTCDTIDQSRKPQSGLVIQNNYSSTPILCFSEQKAFLWSEDTTTAINQFKRYNAGFLSVHNINSIERLSPRQSADSFFNPPFAFINGKRMAIITETRWRHYKAAHPIKIDYLIITKTYYGNLSDLLDTFDPDMVILSGAMFDDKSEKIIQEAKHLNIKLHNLKTDGATVIYD